MKSAFTVPMGPWLVTAVLRSIAWTELGDLACPKLTVGNIGSTWFTRTPEVRVGGGVETEGLIGRGFMPKLDARSDVHGEGGAENHRVSPAHMPQRLLGR
jgi:hypothetical protein